MMRFLLAAVATLAAVTALVLLFREDAGYVMIGFGRWQVETTLAMLLFLVLLAFALFYLLIRLLANTYRMPRQLAGWRRERRRRLARKYLNRGLIALAEGKWAQAEKLLIRHVADSENPLINYLAAARAAQQLGALERRDRYLKLAHEAVPDADVAVGLSQAELQIAGHQMEQALATLNHLREIAPRHEYVLRMLLRLHERLGDWEQLLGLLPQARRRRVLSVEDANRLETEAYLGLIERSGEQGDLAGLQAAWKRVPRHLQQDPDLALAYARRLAALGEAAEAEGVLRKAIRQHWDERLVDAYGRIRTDHPENQLQQAEAWLEGHENNPVLLLALARLAMHSRLWGKARAYLEASLGMHPTVEGYQLLASLLEQMGETEAAIDSLRKGMALATRQEPALPAPRREPGGDSRAVAADAEPEAAPAPAQPPQ